MSSTAASGSRDRSSGGGGQMEALRAAAKESALATVAGMLQRPDQLEKLEAYKRRSERKKAALEAMLKTGVQSQLEGVKKGLGQLHSASLDVASVGENLTEIADLVTGFEELERKLRGLSREHRLHSQLGTALENLRQIFNVQEIIAKTAVLIDEDRLLPAHQNLMELESARDAIMLEVHRSQTQSEYDNNLLKAHFRELEKLGTSLWGKCKGILHRTLDSVRGADPGPQSIVTVLRIVEREERIDEYCEGVEREFGWAAVGRPRKWREATFRILDQTVRTRIEGNQLEERSENKQWLARYLETCRQVVVGDLRTIRGGAVACFPPSYGIYERYVRLYHEALAERLREIAADPLEKNELFQLLTWLRTYTSEDMLGQPALKIAVDRLPLLLPATTARGLCDAFLQHVSADLRNWLARTLQQEKDDWYADGEPDLDSDDHYYTTLPSILIQMVEDQVELGRKINLDLIPRVLGVASEEMIHFARSYRDAFQAYKGKKFEDRDRFRHFTAVIISVANNCSIFHENIDNMKAQVSLSMEAGGGGKEEGRERLLQLLDSLKRTWRESEEAALACLQEEVEVDLGEALSLLFSRKWLESGGGEGCGTVCVTLDDYQADHSHLKPHLRAQLLGSLQLRVLQAYLRGVETRRLVCANEEERRKAAEVVGSDGRGLAELFEGLAPPDQAFHLLTDVLPAIADVLSLGDKSLLSLELSGFVRKFPDAGLDLVAALCAVRGDVGRSEARATAQEILQRNKFRPADESPYARLFRPTEEDAAALGAGGGTLGGLGKGLTGPTSSLLANVMSMASLKDGNSSTASSQAQAASASSNVSSNPFEEEPQAPPRRSKESKSASSNPFDE